MNVKRVGIIANTGKNSAAADSLKLGTWLTQRGIRVAYEEELARILDKESVPPAKLPGLSDMIVVFGGDGTLLRAARIVQGHNVPLLGINLGAFGFMTVVNLHEMFDTLERILAGDYELSRRMMLDAEIRDHHFSVLNDAVINRGNLSRMVNLETFVDDRYLATFKADGLIISTPTGSTAYSLSTGGPIVFPELDSMIITPICPHTLTNRPIVVPPESKVTVMLFSREEGATVTLDGQDSLVIASGETVTIKKSEHSVELFDSPNRDYMQVLRGKLGWGGIP
ncbi:MAG: NAD(+)/NADH kinase [Syntrophales bacterium]|jgi:NAD+ kinase|nr:NAD(+)/NADH kinase [Syntrophales bacterium]MCK9527156.1 NAD(+)/NADH kinase [Syntrophales bacterium]MDX9921719.1 NAD(+)/NADH kinase [Syntrophales bacterium]